MLSCFSCVQLFATPWTVAHQAPLSVGLPRWEYWSGLPFPPLGDLPRPGIEPKSPVLAGGFFKWSRSFLDSKSDTFWPLQAYRALDGFVALPWNMLPYDPASPLLGLSEDTNSKRYMHSCVHSSTIYNSQDLGATNVHWQINKDVRYIRIHTIYTIHTQ